jgi:hypothetical protein
LGRKRRKSLFAPQVFRKKKAGEWFFCLLLGIRINFDSAGAHVAQLVEHVLGKDEVISSILIMGSNINKKA